MKYNKKVIEDVDMDFSAIPETEPTLGVVAGRDRLDTANRSLIKRRPVSQKESLLLDSKEGKMMGTERVDLSQVKGGQNVSQLVFQLSHNVQTQYFGLV